MFMHPRHRGAAREDIVVTFRPSDYANFVAVRSPVVQRVSPSYTGANTAFDIIVVGSGMGGGVLADALTERFGNARSILVLEAGSFLYPTHVYNCSRLSNGAVAERFGCTTFWQPQGGDGEFYIHERPQLGFGGRSIFWSGLIPTIQDWELQFFPPDVRAALVGGRLAEAGDAMNQSVSMGETAEGIVDRLRDSPLAEHFEIVQTPRALHQPYLRPNGVSADEFFVEPTGVFNTAELLVNQLGLSSNENSGGEGEGLRLLLNQYVEDVRRLADNRLEVIARDTLTGQGRAFQAQTVVLAAGSIESPKLLNRSTLGRTLSGEVRGLIGRGLTDHPTTAEVKTLATHIGDLEIPRRSMAKIIFYSRGIRDGDRIRYPFNVEMNVNHEYWHLRENDPTAEPLPAGMAEGDRIVDIKFSFGNCLDANNSIEPAPDFGYVPELRFRNQSRAGYLCGSRFPALAGWQTDEAQVFDLLNGVAAQIFARFSRNNAPCEPLERYELGGRGFGLGTVHHAAGSLRMPYKNSHEGDFQAASVVDQDLQVRGAENLYVCDMSVMPFASAANPVRTLVALALRLAQEID
jgi:hypothetical protein